MHMSSRSPLFALVVATVLVPVSAMGMASAELYSTNAYFYGRFDARIQYAPGDGVVSTFFLWKEGSDASGAYWNELDYEKIAADCHMQFNNIYGGPKKQHQTTPALGFAICGGYHDYRFEWTPTYIAWVVDGKEIRRDTGADATAYAQNATAGMSIHFNIWPGNSSFGGNINNTTLPVHQYISWVEYSSYDNGNFTVQWHEEFQSSDIPSGWATGDWASPYNLSTHNPQNVAFVNGIAVLSLTEDNATGSPGTPPVDPTVGGTGGAGGSSGTGGTTSTGGGGTGGASSAVTGGATSTGGHSTGGMTGAGGSTSTGGSSGTGGSSSTGGTAASSGNSSTGGTTKAGGSSSTGGTATSSGNSSTGGTTSSGGSSSAVAATASGGTTISGGNSSTGGASASSGTIASGGSMGTGGATGTGGTTATGGAASGDSAATTTTPGGCGCRAASAPSPFGPALVVLFLLVSRLRRKEV